ncbi:MAG: AI-2E family transporter [Cyanobacteria bacterium J06598_1]
MSVQQPKIVSLLISLASVVLIIAGLKTMAGLLTPILLSLFLVLVTAPLLAWLRQKGLPSWLSYLLILLAVFVVGLFFILFLATSLNQLLDLLPTYSTQIQAQVRELWGWLGEQGIDSEDIQALSWLQPERLLQISVTITTTLLSTVSNVGLTLIIFVYMLATAPGFSVRLRKGLQNDLLTLQRLESFAQSTSAYLLIKGWLGALTALAQIVLMWMLGLDFAVLWGVLSFLLNFVPNIGFYLAVIPPLLLAVIQLGWLKAILFALVYVAINNFFDLVIAPKYLAEGLDLSALVTFLAVIIWAWILGPIGAFLALPLTVMVKKLLLEPFEQTQLIAGLLGAGEGEA